MDLIAVVVAILCWCSGGASTILAVRRIEGDAPKMLLSHQHMDFYY
jgi:hypothetical protein